MLEPRVRSENCKVTPLIGPPVLRKTIWLLSHSPCCPAMSIAVFTLQRVGILLRSRRIVVGIAPLDSKVCAGVVGAHAHGCGQHTHIHAAVGPRSIANIFSCKLGQGVFWRLNKAQLTKCA